MDIRKQLLSDHSKSNTEEIVLFLLENPERLNQVMDLFFHWDTREKQRTAWVVGDLGRVEVKMIQPSHAKMIANLKVPKLHDAVKQNSIRYLSEAEIGKDPWGEA